MSLLSRLLRPRADDRAVVRPLWHRTVAIAREPGWYAGGGIADTVAGRFDAITFVLSLVLLRMERESELVNDSARLTELFVEDMDGQLRESGVGDLVVGKRMGRLMSVLGGRLDALRAALAQDDDMELIAVIERNVSLAPHGDAARIAADLRPLAAALAALPAEQLLTGAITR